jgi:predicted nucleic acid-binding protein
METRYREDGAIIVWWGSRVECDSAVARLEREGTLIPGNASEALRRLDLLSSSWQEIQPQEILRENARRLLRAHNLRAADALQLSAAIAAAEGRPASLTFVCLDARLALAAEREGFQVLGL